MESSTFVNIFCLIIYFCYPVSARSQGDSGYGSSLNSSLNTTVSSRNYSTQSLVLSKSMNSVRRNSTSNYNARTNQSDGNGFNRTGHISTPGQSNQWNSGRTNQDSFHSSSSARKPLATMSGNEGNSGNTDGGNEVVCNCGNDAIQLTVRKEGPNTGNLSQFAVRYTVSLHSAISQVFPFIRFRQEFFWLL